MSIQKDDNGKYPAFAWPGGYPIFYVFADGEPCCPACANGENNSEASETSDDPGWRIVAMDVNYEDEQLSCAHCNKHIPAAYVDNDN